MTRTEKILVFSYYGVAAAAAANYLRVRRTERAKRKQILIKLDQDLAAIKLAEKRMLHRIESGEYDNSLKYLFTDTQFEIIAAHYEK